jgi:hypothetical protein
MILQVRSAWQQLDASTPPLPQMQTGVAEEGMNTAYLQVSIETPDRVPLSLTA